MKKLNAPVFNVAWIGFVLFHLIFVIGIFAKIIDV